MLKSYLNIQAKFAGLFLWFTLSEFVVMITKKFKMATRANNTNGFKASHV
jgi:hypothetical protein